jgi:thiol-disulfide isomerase/thioredoxin
MRTRLVASAFVLSVSLALSACGSAATPTASTVDKTTAMADKTTAPAATAMAKGAYVSYADYTSNMSMYQGNKVVLFFHAPWCPDCRATDAALTGAAVPDGLTVVKVDYDSMTELKKQYGITQQHTFVQVDGAGALVKKWTGTKDGAAIKAQTV